MIIIVTLSLSFIAGILIGHFAINNSTDENFPEQKLLKKHRTEAGTKLFLILCVTLPIGCLMENTLRYKRRSL